MQKSKEASIRCLQPEAYPHHLQNDGRSIEGVPSCNNKNAAHPGGVIHEPKGGSSSEAFVPPGEAYHRAMNQLKSQEFCMWSTFNHDYQKAQQSQWNAFENFNYNNRHVPVDNRVQHLPFTVLSQGYLHEFPFQEFQYFVVIDFEATCDKDKRPHPQEIIEFPSVLVNSVTGQLEASFQTYVRPVAHPSLTDFCKELTGIQQFQVDRGVPLSEALLMHDKWLEDKGIKHTNFAVVTWSNWDCRVMLESECNLKNICKPPYFNRWINLKVPFSEVYGGARCNLREAVQLAGLVWEGRAHCGLDDARNTARLLTHIMHMGFRFSITSSLPWRPSDGPMAMEQSLGRPLGPTYYSQKPMRQLSASPVLPVQFHHHFPPYFNNVGTDWRTYCYCGAKTIKRMISKPGPRQGSYFFGCGNWTATRGAMCPFFEWASST